MDKQLKLAKKIKELREKMGLSQEDFAKKIELSRVAVSQFENGKRSIGALELAKIAEFFNVSVDNLLKDESNNLKSEDVAKKYFKFNPEKLKNVILYILEKCGGKPNVGETVLYKLLYFIDFDNFEIYGKPVTGMNYLKLQFGPVPKLSEYNKVIEQMKKNRELEIIESEYHGMKQKRYIALIDADKDSLLEEEKNVINIIISKYSDFNARTIENYVHGDAPWKETVDKEIINYNLVFKRVPPYANRDYEFEFMQAGANDIIDSLPPLSKEEHDYYKNL